MHLNPASPPAKKSEPTIALINVVFLMLVFFLIAGTLAPPVDRDVTLVETAGLEGREPPDAVVIHSDGTMTLRGETIEMADIVTRTGERAGDGKMALRLVPDRELPAKRLVEIGTGLSRAGADRVFIVTERGLE